MAKKEKENELKVRLVCTEPLLGTLPGNEEIARDFVLAKHPEQPQQDEEEAAAETVSAAEVLEKTSTMFSRLDGKPIMWDYQIKGFFKDACQAMIISGAIKQEVLKKVRLQSLWIYKKTIDLLVFVNPRRIELQIPGGVPKEMAFLERPLRGQTMRGERIALVRSEMLPAGTTLDITINTLDPNLMPYIKQWLDYGALRGLGQWRNGSYGRFSWGVV